MIAASSSRVLTVAVLFAIGAGVTTARAQTNWNTTVGSWFVPGNWDNGVPNAATTVTTVVNGGTAQIANAPADAGALLIIGGATAARLRSCPVAASPPTPSRTRVTSPSSAAHSISTARCRADPP